MLKSFFQENSKLLKAFLPTNVEFAPEPLHLRIIFLLLSSAFSFWLPGKCQSYVLSATFKRDSKVC